MSTEVRVPQLGESVTEATVATWFKKVGDQVDTDEVLCELETDKVSVEVPSPASGELGEIVAEEGQTVEVDALLATIGEAADGGGSGGNGADADDEEPKAAKANGGDTAKASDDGEAEDGGETVAVDVPALGESVTEATVATWFKSEGDSVDLDEILCELETDKVSVEVPSPAKGTLAKLRAKEGDTVEAGGQLAEIAKGGVAKPDGGARKDGEGAAAKGDGEGPSKAEGEASQKGAPKAEAAQSPGAQQGRDVEDAPSAKKLMAEKNLTRDDVQASGKGGRILKEDVLKALEQGGKPQEEAPKQQSRAPSAPEDADREERVKMTRLRRTIASRLKQAQNTAAMLTTYNEADMTAIMALRDEFKEDFQKKHGVKLGFMSFFTKACVHALIEVPDVNAEIDGDEIVYKNFVHMGVAVGTPNGLVVPVVRDAHDLSFAAIEKKIGELGKAARDGKLKMSDMQGGTFTISNGGIYGSLMSSPILNPPQSGILGMHKIQERPMVEGGEIVIRPMMYLALSYDHRIVDGKDAVTFLVRVKEALEDPRRLLMDL